MTTALDVEDGFHFSKQRNPDGVTDKSALVAMDERLELQLERARATSVLAGQVALTEEELEVRKAARKSLMNHLGIEGDLVDLLRASRRQRVGELTPVVDVRHAPYGWPGLWDMSRPAGSMEMWWAQTNWWWNAPGITMSWQDDGPHMSGVVHVNSDPLQKYSITILAEFALGADRIPATERGRVRSAPYANVFGWMQAIAKDFGFFTAFDDQWVKCWLNTWQSVWVTIPGSHHPFFGDSQSWAFASQSRNIFFLEGMGVETSYLPGRVAMPAVEFELIPQISNVQISLGFTFDMQLEGGDSNLVFGGEPDWPSNVVQTPQWTLRSA